MKGTDYAFAVAQVRSMEKQLLTNEDLANMVVADKDSDIISLLALRGWQIDDSEALADTVISLESSALYSMISELVDDNDCLKIFNVKNDFHNIKTAIKAVFSNITGSELYITPTDISVDGLTKLLSEKRFYDLPGLASVAAEKAYNAVAETMDGQLADIICDRYAMESMLELSKNTTSELIRKYVEFYVVTSNIKIAYRAAVARKSAAFMEEALCENPILPNEKLISSALKGREDVLSMLRENGFEDAADGLNTSLSAYEKWVDDSITAFMREARMTAFGIEPIIAYYYARLCEIKNVSIILTCRSMRTDSKTITERMRESYA